VCLSIYLPIYFYGCTAFVVLGRFFSSLIYTQSVGLLGLGISPSEGRYIHRTTQTKTKRTQTSIPRVGFEPTIPVFERAKTVHALDRAATVIGCSFSKLDKNICVKINVQWNELLIQLCEKFLRVRFLNVLKKPWDILLQPNEIKSIST
jgi:hypothetical protein